MAGNISGISPQYMNYNEDFMAQQYFKNAAQPNSQLVMGNQMKGDTVSFSGGEQQEKKGGGGLLKLAIAAAVGFLAYKKIPAFQKFCKNIAGKLGFGKKLSPEALLEKRHATASVRQVKNSVHRNFAQTFEKELEKGKNISNAIKEQMQNPGKYVVEDLRKIKPGHQYELQF